MRPSRRHYLLARVALAAWAAFSGLNASAATQDDPKAAITAPLADAPNAAKPQ